MTPEPQRANVTHLYDWQSAPTEAPNGERAVFAPDRNAVPGYELLGEIGRGGMGVVYRAKHLGLNREVALKMVLSGVHAGSTERARFRAEAETVAQLQHPNVVQIYDVGEANGLPYLSLEVCAGSLADHLNGTPWEPERAARFIITLARAAHAAHTAGVIHRDLKPGNVLIAADGTPKLTDFGLAKRMGDSGGPTATGAVLGTPSYMAPEQASGTIQPGQPRTRIFGPPTDVYALGAILYEMLTGRPPFAASSPLDTLIMVTRDDPVPPIRLAPKVPRDLQTICLKCLEKEPSRRYATAADLANDLERFLNSEPIVARPVSAWERGVKWAKRRPASAALIAVVIGGIATLASLGWYFTGQLRQERDTAMKAQADAEAAAREAAANFRRAEAEALNARRNNYVLAMGQAQLAWQQSAMSRMRSLLKQLEPRPGTEDLRGFEWYYWNRAARGAPRVLTMEGPNPIVEALAFSPDGRHILAAGRGGLVCDWDTQSLKCERTVAVADGGLTSLAYCPEQRWLAVGSQSMVTILDAAAGTVQRRMPVDSPVTALAVRSDGLIAVQHARDQILGRVDLWDGNTGKRVRSLTGQSGIEGPMAFSPDGQTLAVGGLTIRLWNVASGDFSGRIQRGMVGGFSPDGRRIAVSAYNPMMQSDEIRVHSAATGQVLARWPGHSQRIMRMAFSLDGRYLASAGMDHTVRLWDAGTGQELRRFRTRSRWNMDVAFQPASDTLAVATAAGVVELWPADFDPESVTRRAHTMAGAQSVAVHPDSGRVAAVGFVTGVIDDLATQKTVSRLGVSPRTVETGRFSPDGRRLALALKSGEASLFDVETGRILHALRHPSRIPITLAFSGDGRRLAVATRAQPDRRAAAPRDHVTIWDVDTGQRVGQIEGGGEPIVAISLSRDGQRLLTGSPTPTYRLWDVNTGRLIVAIPDRSEGTNETSLAALSPDGRRAAVTAGNWIGATDPTIDIVDLETGERRYTLAGHSRRIRALTFSNDGTRLASAAEDDVIRVWDSTLGQEVLSRPAPSNIVDLGFTSDGRKLIAVSQDGTTRIWQGEG